MPEYYLGIDVGYSRTDATTGLCLITLDQNQLRWECRNSTTDPGERLEDLRSLIPCGVVLNGIGIDGPLGRGLGPINHYRAAEALLNDGEIRKCCNPSPANSGSGPSLHDHATKLARLFLALQCENHCNIAGADHPDAIHQSRIVEAFPDAFLAFLLPSAEIPCGIPRGERSDRYWEVAVRKGYLKALIRRLAPGIGFGSLDCIRNHDRRAAFICALSAMCVAKNKYASVGDPKYGDIILPPREVWGFDHNDQPDWWPKAPLRANVDLVRRNRRRYQNHENARVIRNGHQCLPGE